MSPTPSQPRQLVWRKALRSMNNGNCVEVTSASGKIMVRDSRDPGGVWLMYPSRTWNAFLDTVKIK